LATDSETGDDVPRGRPSGSVLDEEGQVAWACPRHHREDGGPPL